MTQERRVLLAHIGGNLMFRTSVLFLATAALFGPTSSVAIADSAQDAAEAELAVVVVRTDQACKTSLTVAVDWSSFAGKYKAGKKGYSGHDEAYVGSSCSDIVRSIENFCGRSERHQQGVAEHLESITCKWDPKATREKLEREGVTWKRKKKALTVGYNWKTRDFGDRLRFQLNWWWVDNGSVTEEKYRDAKLYKEHVKPAEKACKKKFDVSIDWPSFRGKYRLEKGSYETAEVVASGCGNIVASVGGWCYGGEEHDRFKAIAKGVDKIVCKWDPKATEKKLDRLGSIHKIKRKRLVAGYNWKTSNVGEGLNDYLIKKFKIKDPTRATSGPCKGKSGRALLACLRKVEGPVNQCHKGCNKRCKGTKNRSRCLGKCRRACR